MTKSSAHPNQITQGLHLRYHPTPETLGLEYQDGGYYTSQVCPRRAAKTKYFLFCEEGNYGSLDRTFWEERTLQTYCFAKISILSASKDLLQRFLSCLQAKISYLDDSNGTKHVSNLFNSDVSWDTRYKHRVILIFLRRT